MLETVLFYLLSFGVLSFGIGVIVSRSATYSVLCLVAAMGMTAGLFVLLKAFLVATILVLVYAGAILVLFLFVVMFVDFKKLSTDWQGSKLSPVLAVSVGALIFLQTKAVIRSIPQIPEAHVHGTTGAIGEILFNHYILPFELTAFLLLAAIVSVVVLAKRDL